MNDVELIYFKGCPNIKAARQQLLKAFKLAELPPEWVEWDNQAEDAPDYTRQYGSPTILVKGKDVSQNENSDAACCRVYNADDGMQGIPALADVQKALKENIKPKTPRAIKSGSRGWLASFAIVPAILSPLVPGLTCPACWPAYAGLLSSLGISFVDYTPYLLPLISVFLITALFTLYWRAPQRRGYWPLTLGAASSVMILIGKFYFANESLTYIGIALLVFATIWNVWPAKRSGHCPACT